MGSTYFFKQREINRFDPAPYPTAQARRDAFATFVQTVLAPIDAGAIVTVDPAKNADADVMAGRLMADATVNGEYMPFKVGA